LPVMYGDISTPYFFPIATPNAIVQAAATAAT